MVGYTLFTPKGFKTMYRHFNNLETAKLFASNKDLKDNCKIYVDLEVYKKEKNSKITVAFGGRRYGTEAIVLKDYVSIDKIKELLNKLNVDDSLEAQIVIPYIRELLKERN